MQLQNKTSSLWRGQKTSRWLILASLTICLASCASDPIPFPMQCSISPLLVAPTIKPAFTGSTVGELVNYSAVELPAALESCNADKRAIAASFTK